MRLVVSALTALLMFGAEAPKTKASKEELLLIELANYKATAKRLGLEVESLKKRLEVREAEDAERELRQKSLYDLLKNSGCKEKETFNLENGVITCRAAEAPSGK